MDPDKILENALEEVLEVEAGFVGKADLAGIVENALGDPETFTFANPEGAARIKSDEAIHLLQLLATYGSLAVSILTYLSNRSKNPSAQDCFAQIEKKLQTLQEAVEKLDPQQKKAICAA